MAGIGSRFIAALVDTLLISLLQGIVIGTLALIVSQLTDLASSVPNEQAWGLAIGSLISFIFLWGYYIFFEILWNGQTPGKRWGGLRVIRLDGTPVTASEVVIRNLVRVLDMLPFAYGVGVVAMFIDENSRRLGDLAAGTVVVHEGGSEIPIESPHLDASPAARRGSLPAGFPVERLTVSDLQIIEEFLQRHDQLSNRKRLAEYILNSISARLGLPEATFAGLEAEDILTAIYMARQSSNNH